MTTDLSAFRGGPASDPAVPICPVAPPVRAGVIGLGRGYAHAQAYHEGAHTALSALCDVDDARLAASAVRLAAPYTFADPYELLHSGEVDVVSIATPNAAHYELTLAALEAGLHVLCEKPLALNGTQAQEMAAAAARAGRVLMVNYTYRFAPASQALQAAMAGGALGEVYFARSVWHRSRGVPGLRPGGGVHRDGARRDGARRDGAENWFVQRATAGGGALIDLGVHRLDLALWFMGFPPVASVSGVTYNAMGRAYAQRTGGSFDVEDMAVGFVRFANGASLVLEASWDLNQPRAELMETWVYGTAGGMLQRNVGNLYQFEAELYRHDPSGAFQVSELRPGPEHQRTAFDEFIDSVVAGRAPSASADQAVIALRVIDALYESAASGREVRL